MMRLCSFVRDEREDKKDYAQWWAVRGVEREARVTSPWSVVKGSFGQDMYHHFGRCFIIPNEVAS